MHLITLHNNLETPQQLK